MADDQSNDKRYEGLVEKMRTFPDFYSMNGSHWYRSGKANPDCVLAAEWIERLERENLELRHDLDRAMANHNADLNAVQSAHEALKQLIEAVDGLSDMDEADGHEFFDAERRLESAMENAKRCLYVGERS